MSRTARRRLDETAPRSSPDGDEIWLNWVLWARAGGRAIGWVQATVRGGAASVTYAVLPVERGQGAASDAVRAMLGWLRSDCGVAEVTASIATENLASARVARAAGFEPTDRLLAGEVVWRASSSPPP